MKNPKAKGSQFEREVCKKLSCWLTNDEREDVLWRSAMSGGRATIAAKKGKRLTAQAGDITSIHPESAAFTDIFLIECKFYRDLQIHKVFKGGGRLVSFWNDVVREAGKYRKKPMLIAKQNNLPELVVLNSCGSKLFNGALHSIIYPYGMHIILFDDLLKTKPQYVSI